MPVFDGIVIHISGSAIIRAERAYNAASGGIKAGAYATKIKDANGYETKYTYDLERGRLQEMETADGTQTEYTYDTNTDQLTYTE